MTVYSPHTENDVDEMLAVVGVGSLDELFDAIPAAVRLNRDLTIDRGLSEFDVMEKLESDSELNTYGKHLVCFAGGGAYDHDIPSAVRRLMFRTEFVTAYTPYQPEVSQGVLQALFEFQTFVTRLFGLPVANASLYDGATALVEAINIACAETQKSRVLMSGAVNPRWRDVATTYAQGTGHDFVLQTVVDGITNWESQDAAAVVVQYPNYLGNIENLNKARQAADASGARLIVIADIVSLGLLNSPGDLGADIVVAEGQPFGTPLSFGGPYVGLIAVKEDLLRRIPGRLVGETIDHDGRRAFVTTLRTREQDIRREKASSNICTNQTLIAIGFAIHASMLGTSGLVELASRCVSNTHYLVDQIETRTSLRRMSSAPFARECAIAMPRPGAEIIDELIDAGFLGGIPLDSIFEQGILVTATEKRTKSEIDSFVDALVKVTS